MNFGINLEIINKNKKCLFIGATHFEEDYVVMLSLFDVLDLLIEEYGFRVFKFSKPEKFEKISIEVCERYLFMFPKIKLEFEKETDIIKQIDCADIVIYFIDEVNATEQDLKAYNYAIQQEKLLVNIFNKIHK